MSQNDQSQADNSSFGYQDVDPSEKPGLVQGVFSSVAGNYDLMSGGVHRLWKSTLIDLMKPRPDDILLDVAGGTGDIAARYLDAGGGRVAVCDLTEAMVMTGRDRMIDEGRLAGIDWTVGDAQALPVPDKSVSVYSIAFGLRNVTDINAALAEAYRVLQPGGRYFCLEFSHVALPFLDKLYDTYSFKVLPLLGQVVAKDRESYQYLAESIRRFPDQETLKEKMKAAGFEMVRHQNLSGGIAAIHSGWRI